ncbi:hypothetical protein AQ611_24125 [Burkholderia singularis]|nr:hypothetical protein AQ611_24125 [Burkholderia sp. Bp7605]
MRAMTATGCLPEHRRSIANLVTQAARRSAIARSSSGVFVAVPRLACRCDTLPAAFRIALGRRRKGGATARREPDVDCARGGCDRLDSPLCQGREKQ